MDTTHFDALIRTASRRGSLLAFGGAGLAAMTGAFGAAARNKAGKAAKKKVKTRCKAQVGQCNAAFNNFCDTNPDPDECKQAVQTCCTSLATCNAGAMAQCLIGALLI